MCLSQQQYQHHTNNDDASLPLAMERVVDVACTAAAADDAVDIVAFAAVNTAAAAAVSRKHSCASRTRNVKESTSFLN